MVKANRKNEYNSRKSDKKRRKKSIQNHHRSSRNNNNKKNIHNSFHNLMRRKIQTMESLNSTASSKYKYLYSKLPNRYNNKKHISNSSSAKTSTQMILSKWSILPSRNCRSPSNSKSYLTR